MQQWRAGQPRPGGAVTHQRTRARLGHPVHRQRVAAQVREVAAVGETLRCIHALKHFRHADDVEAGAAQHAVAQAVGLALHLAREIQLPLDGRRLPARDGRVRNVGRGAAAGREHAQEDRCQPDHRSAAARCDAARDVPLRDVRQLVRHHRRELVARGGDGNQPEVHADITARQSKCIHAALGEQKGLPRKRTVGIGVDVAAFACGGHQRCPDRLQVVQQHRVVQVGRVAPAFAHDLLADALFGRDAQVVGG